MAPTRPRRPRVEGVTGVEGASAAPSGIAEDAGEGPAREAETHAAVLVPVPGESGEDTFTYRVPDGTTPGERVEVSFGSRTVVGFVVSSAEPRPDAKPILARVDGFPVVTEELLELTRWMARECLVPWYRCLEAAVPQGLKFRAGAREKTRRVVSLAPGLDWEAVAHAAARSKGPEGGEVEDEERLRSMFAMVGAHPVSLTPADIQRRFGISRTRIDTLVRKGHLGVSLVVERRDPLRQTPVVSDSPRELTPDQAAALERLAALSPGDEMVLWGVTGSGKTEVYLQAIASVLESGRGALVLVPEIALTPQTVDRFRARLGETVAILHSALSPGERYDEWLRILRGQSRVVVGARSAVFAPVAAPGLIVIDEAHEHSFKQSETPRYHAVEVARRRAVLTGARLLLGTATPLCEHVVARRGPGGERVDPVIARLERRIAERPLPPVTVVDMRLELAAGNTAVWSRALADAIDETLERREQALLFLNRRGAASFVLCRACGEAIRCSACDVTLTPHEYGGGPAGGHGAGTRVAGVRAPGAGRGASAGGSQLVCHFCNHRVAVPTECPSCGSRKIKSFGAGTERIEAEARKRWPNARIARMDADTTIRKGAHREILGRFAAGEIDLLVGTQMIGKGLDIPRVTLVGVVAAETSLHVPDFRAAERTFSLLVQVLGRAGRAERPGRAIVQTYQPETPSVALAARHDVPGFLRSELRRREAGGLPPYARMAQWTVEVGPTPGVPPRGSFATLVAAADEEAARVCGLLASVLRTPAMPPGRVLGPAPAPVERLRGRQRWQVRWLTGLDLAPEARLEAMAAATRAARESAAPRRSGLEVRILFDNDPVDLM